MQTEADIDPRLASELIESWRAIPQLFCRDVLGIKQIWRLQDDLLNACPVAIRERKPIYIGSGHALGKDYIAAAASLWFLHSYSPSIVIQTAPTDRQVKKIMWGETMRHFNNINPPLGGKPYSDPYLEINKEDWYLLGFTTKESGASKQAQGGKFQGFHSPNMCVVVSEAQAVEDDIRNQIDAIATSEKVLLIFIGNPTRSSGWFAKGLKDKGRNIVFNFSCLDNPNYKQKKTVIPGLASYEWVEDKRQRWGVDSPLWFGRVLGQIPKTAINNIFSELEIETMKRRALITPSEAEENRGVALDVAGEGDDESVAYAGAGGHVLAQSIKVNQSAGENALTCQNLTEAHRGNFIVVDCDGMGIKEYQELTRLELSKTVNVVKFHGCGASSKQKGKQNDFEFENLRAEAWFTAQSRARDGGASIPDDPLLIEELLEVTAFENRRGKIQIEEKQDIKDRLGRSPDRADSWVMLQWGFEQNYKNRRRDRVRPDQDIHGHGVLPEAAESVFASEPMGGAF